MSSILAALSIVSGVAAVAWVEPSTSSGAVFLALLTAILCFLLLNLAVMGANFLKSFKSKN